VKGLRFLGDRFRILSESKAIEPLDPFTCEEEINGHGVWEKHLLIVSLFSESRPILSKEAILMLVHGHRLEFSQYY
jgi:hypothetical protein